MSEGVLALKLDVNANFMCKQREKEIFMRVIATPDEARQLRNRLTETPLVLVGLMGSGKSTIGRKVAQALGMAFYDADNEIEAAARMTIPELFEAYGEAEFRSLEQRVVLRLVSQDEGAIISTGGGAFINPEIRDAIKQSAVSLWLNAELDLLMSRVEKRPGRPLLQTEDPRGTMQLLMDQRYPIYEEADVMVTSSDVSKEDIARAVVLAVLEYFEKLDAA